MSHPPADDATRHRVRCIIPVPDKNDVFGIALFRRPMKNYGDIGGIVLTIGDNSRRSRVLRANGAGDSIKGIRETFGTKQRNRRHRYGREHVNGA